MINHTNKEIPEHQKWIKGHIGRFWSDEYKTYNYIRQPVTQEEIDEWVSKGYDYVKSYTGEMYDNRNVMPKWLDSIRDIFFLYKDMTFTFYKMNTLDIMPEHSDHYRTYRKLYNAEYDNTYRILLMLEDWKPGHYLEIDGVGIVNWIAGDYFMWRGDCPHAASNIGVDPRYTLQITANKIKQDECWTQLHWYNIPNINSKNESTVYMMERIYNLLPEDHKKKPLFIYMYNGKLKDLDKFNHSDDEIKVLNDQGVNFYLTEPLCSYLNSSPQYYKPKGTRHDMMFYSEFTGHESKKDFRSDELDSILEYITRNKLQNVTVYTCDYDAQSHYPYYDSFMKIRTKDMFVASITPKKIIDPVIDPTFTTKFMCLNWRYTTHRNMIAAYVSRLSSYVSWYFRGEFSIVGKSKWFDIHEIKDIDSRMFLDLLAGIENLNVNAPMNVDFNIKNATTVIDKYFMNPMPLGEMINIPDKVAANPTLEKKYKDIFVDIVTESRFAQPTGNYSEKVYQPMWYKKPFILAAPPFTLKFLREEGFKTFNDFWDESYDEIVIHRDRLLKIFELIDFIDNMSINDLQKMYSKMNDIVEHNYKMLLEKLPPISQNE